ncbi:hypothetical protein FACS189452_09450 [Bacteroidia bacterium]|nr:hypothetical protein FACS189452_09450 [Bacteroidia bacterium]GHT80504.1 hypothetical protein FACS189467_2820 [Bacteroidia bacterium]
MKNICSIAIIASVILCGSCGNKKQQPVRTQVGLSQGKILYPIPTAYEVTNRINQSGAAFVIGITNPVGNAEKYLTEAQKALNVGIYGADLAYVSTYNMEQETRNYLKALHTLTNALDISTNFNADLVRQVEQNIDNKDTVINIITRSFNDTYDFLVNNGQDDISLFVLVGTWIEGMYVATYLATTSEKTETMLDIVAGQKSSLHTLLDLLDDTQNADLQQLEAQIAVLKSSLIPADNAKFTLDNAIAFREKIEVLRNSLINE